MLELVAQILVKLNNTMFVAYEMVLARLLPKRKLSIRFSPHDAWGPYIARGFRGSQHTISFAHLDKIEMDSCDVVVPLELDELLSLAHRDCRRFDKTIPIPSVEAISLCHDKDQLNNFLISNGFASFVPKLYPNRSFPYILKKKADQWGAHSYVIACEEDEKRLSKSLCDPDYFRQEMIVGEYEYATHILFKGKAIVYAVNIEYKFRTNRPIKGKDSAIYRKICRCAHLEVFASMLDRIGFEGLCCINYKLRDDMPYIIEINPRFGGSISPYFFAFLRHVVVLMCVAGVLCANGSGA